MRDHVKANGFRRGMAVIGIALALCVTGPGGTATRLSVRGVSFAPPKWFDPELRMLGSEAGYLKHSRFALGVFVAVPENAHAEQAFVLKLGNGLATELFPTEQISYQWKSVGTEDERTKTWLVGSTVQGFNGSQRVLISYRRVLSNGNLVLVGYMSTLGRGPKEAVHFEKNLSGFSIPGDDALEELLKSLESAQPAGG